jgi:endonuclease/exonuclease/phosphatase family metal-dependent hydrolase
MKLLSLNVWGGRLFGDLMSYIGEIQKDVDIFCFQEVYTTVTAATTSKNEKVRYNLFAELCDLLFPNFYGFFSSHHDNHDFKGIVDHHVSYGLATFIRRQFPAVSGDIFVFGNRNYPRGGYPFIRSRTLQYIMVADIEGKPYTICNFHGLWNGEGKGDSEERMIQSRNVRMFLDQIPYPKILCGDFNLAPGMMSLAMLEEQMRNLVLETNVACTRSSHYPKRESEPYADYILVSSNIGVHMFQVVDREVSDHLPLLLDFTV